MNKETALYEDSEDTADEIECIPPQQSPFPTTSRAPALEPSDPGVLINPKDNPDSLVNQALKKMSATKRRKSEKELRDDQHFEKAITGALEKLHVLEQRTRRDQIGHAYCAACIMKDAIILHMEHLKQNEMMRREIYGIGGKNEKDC